MPLGAEHAARLRSHYRPSPPPHTAGSHWRHAPTGLPQLVLHSLGGGPLPDSCLRCDAVPQAAQAFFAPVSSPPPQQRVWSGRRRCMSGVGAAAASSAYDTFEFAAGSRSESETGQAHARGPGPPGLAGVSSHRDRVDPRSPACHTRASHALPGKHSRWLGPCTLVGGATPPPAVTPPVTIALLRVTPARCGPLPGARRSPPLTSGPARPTHH